MIGIWSFHAKEFLCIIAVLTILFAVPMLFHPLAWARAFKWRIPTETDLAVYFGRCLGGVVTVLACMCFVAANRPETQPFYFSVILTAVGVNISVHIYGAIQKIQPRSETIEIAVWMLLFILCPAFYPNANTRFYFMKRSSTTFT